MEVIQQVRYVRNGRVDKDKRKNVYAFCAACGERAFQIMTVMNFNGGTKSRSLPAKYCPKCNIITILNPDLKVLNK